MRVDRRRDVPDPSGTWQESPVCQGQHRRGHSRLGRVLHPVRPRPAPIEWTVHEMARYLEGPRPLRDQALHVRHVHRLPGQARVDRLLLARSAASSTPSGTSPGRRPGSRSTTCSAARAATRSGSTPTAGPTADEAPHALAARALEMLEHGLHGAEVGSVPEPLARRTSTRTRSSAAIESVRVDARDGRAGRRPADRGPPPAGADARDPGGARHRASTRRSGSRSRSRRATWTRWPRSAARSASRS